MGHKDSFKIDSLKVIAINASLSMKIGRLQIYVFLHMNTYSRPLFLQNIIVTV